MMYSKVAMGGSGYDVIVPSDYMIAQMAEEGLLAELDFDNIPNFSLTRTGSKNLPYDPENLYSVPYTWGTLGLIYNPTLIGGDVDSWGALFDSQYAGKTAMIGNPRDAMAAALMYLGYSINTDDQTQIQEAYQLIADAKANGQYQGFFMDEIYDKMEVGETALCTYYAGDYLSMYMNNPDLKYVVPKEGSNWFVDAMVVLKDAKHKTEAEEWINFICSTEASLRNMDFIWYASPNQRPWISTPPITRRRTGRSCRTRSIRSWLPPRRCWISARCTSTCPPTPAPCITTCGPRWASSDPDFTKRRSEMVGAFVFKSFTDCSRIRENSAWDFC